MSKFSSKVARKDFFSQEWFCSSSDCPDSLRLMMEWSVRCCWCPVVAAWGHSILWCVTVFIFFFKWKCFAQIKQRTHECHLLIFFFFSVGWRWDFCLWHALVTNLAKIRVVLNCHYSYLSPLLSWLLTFLSDSNVYFMGSSLPVGFLLHTAGLSLYLKKKKNKNCH